MVSRQNSVENYERKKFTPFKRFNVFPTLLCYSVVIAGKATNFAVRKTQKIGTPLKLRREEGRSLSATKQQEEKMLTLIDNITIVLCVVGIFAISVFMSKKNTDMEAYYHANKALPWSLAVGTIAASWYGGNGTIGTVGYVTTMGLSAFFIWSIGAHLVRFPLALWVAPRISVKVNSTMTELLDRFYGRIASFIGAIVLLAT